MARPHATDAHWAKLAETEPYWAVLTDPRFERGALDDGARAAFYATGEAWVERLFALVRAHVQPDFAPRRALDFGCGVGRLTLPLARRCDDVLGVDIADAMLREARTAAANAALPNARFERADDALSAAPGPFDLVCSYIVLQHLRADRAAEAFARLADLLAPGGVGALHVAYSRRDYGALPVARFPVPRGASLRTVLRYGVTLAGHALSSAAALLARPDAPREHIEMNPVSLNVLLHALQERGVAAVHVLLEPHGAPYTALLLFRRPAA